MIPGRVRVSGALGAGRVQCGPRTDSDVVAVIKDRLRNAGGLWDRPQVRRGRQLITSRKPEDIPALNRELLAGIRNGAKGCES
jgi:putative intracellular protease/amidase